jgi:tRNA (cytidine/uridine-2'-O-)-methyltransferase
MVERGWVLDGRWIMPIHIVLVEPEIPQNTGNIARTCAATGSALHLIKPLGFSVDDRHLKRAGLDYWHLVEVHYHNSIDDFFIQYPEGDFYFATTKAKKKYSSVCYTPDSFIFFGKETAGLPEALLKKNYDRCIRIPMKKQARSLNLSNSVAILLYEAMRQLDFYNLESGGALTTE